jgi:hypothetical protein
MPKKKKEQKKENKVLMSRIRVIDEVDRYVDRVGTGQWDGDDTTEVHRIQGIRLVGDTAFYDLTVPFIPDRDKDYFLVYVEYDTGDSFHRECGRVCFVDLYEKYEDAMKTRETIEKNMRDYNESENGRVERDYGVRIKNSKGSKYEFNCPWKGYFENFGGARIQGVSLI